MPAKSAGVTPTMVTIWPLIDTTRPIADGSPPNRSAMPRPSARSPTGCAD